MGSKAMGPAIGFSLDVVAEIKRAIQESGLMDKDVIRITGISQDYFYKRMRGDAPFNTNDISKIADALGMDAFIILRRAAIKHDRMSGEERQRIMDAKIDGGFALAASDDPNKRIEAETPDE